MTVNKDAKRTKRANLIAYHQAELDQLLAPASTSGSIADPPARCHSHR